MRTLHAITLAAAVTVSGNAAATNLSVWNFAGAKVIHMDGVISPEDAQRVNGIMSARISRGFYRPFSFVLNSPGGAVVPAISIAEGFISRRASRLTPVETSVPAYATCASACFLVWACGETRSAHVTARIGIHSASNGKDEDAYAYVLDTWMGRILKACGVPEHLIGTMITTPANQIYWLTPADLQAMGVEIRGDEQAPNAADWLVPGTGFPAKGSRAIYPRNHQWLVPGTGFLAKQ
jgi:hypothetical protein